MTATLAYEYGLEQPSIYITALRAYSYGDRV